MYARNCALVYLKSSLSEVELPISSVGGAGLASAACSVLPAFRRLTSFPTLTTFVAGLLRSFTWQSLRGRYGHRGFRENEWWMLETQTPRLPEAWRLRAPARRLRAPTSARQAIPTWKARRCRHMFNFWWRRR